MDAALFNNPWIGVFTRRTAIQLRSYPATHKPLGGETRGEPGSSGLEDLELGQALGCPPQAAGQAERESSDSPRMDPRSRAASRDQAAWGM